MVYLSGPMQGRPHNGREAFEWASKELRKLGFTVFSPHETFNQNAETVLPRERYMRLDHSVIMSVADLIVVLEGWENSPGAVSEVLAAQQYGIPVFTLSGGADDDPSGVQVTIQFNLSPIAKLYQSMLETGGQND